MGQAEEEFRNGIGKKSEGGVEDEVDETNEELLEVPGSWHSPPPLVILYYLHDAMKTISEDSLLICNP